MIKVITYGTYDLLHYGHIRLLERAKSLGDYLIVGVTADDFDKTRGKINVQQSLIERIEAVRATGLADEIIIEEYEGQKIDDIKRYDVDIFTVGSDWKGHFDYLNEYCKVVYLDRTQGVSSTELRSEQNKIRFGLVGTSSVIQKYMKELEYVNGTELIGIFNDTGTSIPEELERFYFSGTYEQFLDTVDAVFIRSMPENHYSLIKTALEKKVHVLCESPLSISCMEFEELQKIAQNNKCILMEAQKTAYSTAYYRMQLLVKSGIIGDVISIDSTCTSLLDFDLKDEEKLKLQWNSITAWGPTAMLPVFQILGTSFKSRQIVSKIINDKYLFDSFTKISFIYDNAVASIKVGKGIKSEGELIISGTKGYVYVPAPWWKTDYFEVRFENSSDNKRYFYQLDGEGIRYELVAFFKSINFEKDIGYVAKDVSFAEIKIIEDFYINRNISRIC